MIKEFNKWKYNRKNEKNQQKLKDKTMKKNQNSVRL